MRQLINAIELAAYAANTETIYLDRPAYHVAYNCIPKNHVYQLRLALGSARWSGRDLAYRAKSIGATRSRINLVNRFREHGLHCRFINVRMCNYTGAFSVASGGRKVLIVSSVPFTHLLCEPTANSDLVRVT